ncbi:hypothetical protein FPRO05_11278 [Fusarium proliferatum]|uniref:Uncharacterized protein n=1 Tax=Gibberella intermedia TaxID=948311 RepID=A0A365N9R3_GIBIN|nr:hypothetical protein FPRO05_11278 [Fusarium proliferatum]
MPNNYQITIINNSDNPQTYLLFQTTPQINPSPGSNVFTNIYQASVEIPPGADANFSITSQWYGINGTSPAQALGNNVKVNTGQGAEVTLGSTSAPGTTLTLTTYKSDGESPEWGPSAPAAATSNGSFQIVTDDTFTPENSSEYYLRFVHLPPFSPQSHPLLNPLLTTIVSSGNIFIGLGAPSADNPQITSPTATFAAEPSMTYTIWPKNTWYICTGSFQAGTIIEVQSVGVTQEVDFENGRPDQTFTHNANGTYSPS